MASVSPSKPTPRSPPAPTTAASSWRASADPYTDSLMPLTCPTTTRALLALTIATTACKSNHDAAAGGTPDAAAAQAAALAATPTLPLPPDDIYHKDPCRYISQAEAESYLGPLLHAPYRGKDDHITADSTGSVCIYRAKDGHSIDVTAQWMDGKSEIKQFTRGFLNQFFVDDKGKTDTLSDVWDQAAIRDGTLYALKGDTLFQVDYAGSTAGLQGAAKLTADALNRLGKPLAYNGAAAATGVPGPLVAPRDPCSLLTGADIEPVMGRLVADPHGDESSCTYPTASGPVVLQVHWMNGFRSLFSDRSAATNAHAMTNQQFFNMDSAFANLNKGMAKPAQKGAPLPRSTDTTITGPWTDSRVGGVDGSLTVVKKDVSMEIQFMPYKPTAQLPLLTAAMNKI